MVSFLSPKHRHTQLETHTAGPQVQRPERPEGSDLGREAHAGETDRPGETELMLHDLMLHVAGEIEAWGAGGGLPFTLPRDTQS